MKTCHSRHKKSKIGPHVCDQACAQVLTSNEIFASDKFLSKKKMSLNIDLCVLHSLSLFTLLILVHQSWHHLLHWEHVHDASCYSSSSLLSSSSSSFSHPSCSPSSSSSSSSWPSRRPQGRPMPRSHPLGSLGRRRRQRRRRRRGCPLGREENLHGLELDLLSIVCAYLVQ